MWVASTTDVRDLQKAAAIGSYRLSLVHEFTNMRIDVNLTDGKAHQLALYFLDWDRMERARSGLMYWTRRAAPCWNANDLRFFERRAMGGLRI